jgi:hypothetical protein
MKKSHLLGAVCAVLFSLITVSANAALVSRLGGAAAYDTVLDITWTTNANIHGQATWDNQVAWAAGFSLGGFDDWRLASMDVNGDTAVVDCSGATELACRDDELGYMFYHNMGGSYGDDKTGDQTVDGVLLTDVQSGYWSGTESAPHRAYLFFFYIGHVIDGGKSDNRPGWAVRAGDVGAVPVPAALWLFGSGLLGLIGIARRKAA